MYDYMKTLQKCFAHQTYPELDAQNALLHESNHGWFQVDVRHNERTGELNGKKRAGARTGTGGCYIAD